MGGWGWGEHLVEEASMLCFVDGGSASLAENTRGCGIHELLVHI